MRTITCHLLIIMSALFYCGELFAQSTKKAMIQFTYDDAGNRIKREIIYITGKKGAGNSAALTDVSTDAGENKTEVENPAEEVTRLDKIGNAAIKLYPNPLKEQLIVEIENTDWKEKNFLQITDMNGKLLYSKEQLEQFNRLNFSPYINGPYILKITIGNQQKEWIVVKQ